MRSLPLLPDDLVPGDLRGRLRAAIRANPRLFLLLVLAAPLFLYGIWRAQLYQMIPDERGAIMRPLLLVHGGPGISDFEKGGNLHVWVLALFYIPVILAFVGYYAVTGQLGSVLDTAQTFRTYEDLWAAPASIQDPFFAIVVAGRFASALAGLLGVLGVALLARRLADDDRAGLLAGAALATTMGYVLTAHYATEDVLAGALLAWTFVFVARYTDLRTDRQLLLASAVAGLAISAKATNGLTALPIGAYALARHDPREFDLGSADGFRDCARAIGRYPAAATATYVATTPSLFLHPGAWLGELGRYFGKVSGESTFYASPDSGLVSHTGNLIGAMGVSLFLLAVVSLVGVVVLAASDRIDRTALAPVSFVVPYFLIITSWQNVQYNRALLLTPLLAVFVGIFGAWLLSVDRPILGRSGVGGPSVRRIAGPVLAIVLLLSLVYTGIGVASFNQSRAEATEWTHANFDASTDVGVIGQRIYLPAFPNETNVSRTEILMEEDPATWQEGLARVQCNQHEYLVLTSFQYTRHFQDPTVLPEVAETYRSLLNEEDYEIVRTFGPDVNRNNDAAGMVQNALRLQPPAKNTGNPRILVLQRTSPPEEPCPEMPSGSANGSA